MIERFFNADVAEYTVTLQKDATGKTKKAYTKYRTYRGRLEKTTAERIRRLYGVEENVEYRLFSLVAPVLGNAVKVGNKYYRIIRVIPALSFDEIHHYESLLAP